MSDLKFAIPKGSLEKKMLTFFEKAGLTTKGYADGSRSYRPDLGMPGVSAKVLRPQEIPYMLAAGFYDIGISGLDWYLESESAANVADLLDLGVGRVDIVLAVPQSWDDINSTADLFQKFVDSTSTHPLRFGRSISTWPKRWFENTRTSNRRSTRPIRGCTWSAAARHRSPFSIRLAPPSRSLPRTATPSLITQKPARR